MFEKKKKKVETLLLKEETCLVLFLYYQVPLYLAFDHSFARARDFKILTFYNSAVLYSVKDFVVLN